MQRDRPASVAGGLLGALLVAALYAAHLLLGPVPFPVVVFALALPGFVAAHIARARGMLGDAEREGAMAGLLTAHFATALQLVGFFVAVLNVDWAAYAAKAGADVAAGVREAVIPAALVAAVAVVAITYAACVLLSWLGAAIYRNAQGRRNV